jgi:hypothetical protein
MNLVFMSRWPNGSHFDNISSPVDTNTCMYVCQNINYHHFYPIHVLTVINLKLQSNAI